MAENQTQTPTPSQTPSSNPDSQARMWCMLCHLAGIVPCIPCLLTVLVWQLKKGEFPAVDVHGKRALNFQISVFLVMVALMIVSVVLSFIHLGFLVHLLMPVIGLGALVLMILAGIKANNGEDYKYPWSLELFK
jgi:uncharacterized protein